MDICSICLEDISLDSAKLYCNHSFHKECIHTWFDSLEKSLDCEKLSCPNCRNDEFEVEAILKYNTTTDKYKIKWSGDWNPSWSSVEELGGCVELLYEFRKQYHKKLEAARKRKGEKRERENPEWEDE